uniref:Uncharacterized protein n=1 Tax=Arundo donax TaxID=35708 RepID=A0A0A8ZFB5_ARUDO
MFLNLHRTTANLQLPYQRLLIHRNNHKNLPAVGTEMCCTAD